jgi:hypothetical protein
MISTRQQRNVSVTRSAKVNAQQDTRSLGLEEDEGAVSYLIGSRIITESDIPMDTENLSIVRFL